MAPPSASAKRNQQPRVVPVIPRALDKSARAPKPATPAASNSAQAPAASSQATEPAVDKISTPSEPQPAATPADSSVEPPKVGQSVEPTSSDSAPPTTTAAAAEQEQPVIVNGELNASQTNEQQPPSSSTPATAVAIASDANESTTTPAVPARPTSQVQPHLPSSSEQVYPRDLPPPFYPASHHSKPSDAPSTQSGQDQPASSQANVPGIGAKSATSLTFGYRDSATSSPALVGPQGQLVTPSQPPLPHPAHAQSNVAPPVPGNPAAPAGAYPPQDPHSYQPNFPQQASAGPHSSPYPREHNAQAHPHQHHFYQQHHPNRMPYQQRRPYDTHRFSPRYPPPMVHHAGAAAAHPPPPPPPHLPPNIYPTMPAPPRPVDQYGDYSRGMPLDNSTRSQHALHRPADLHQHHPHPTHSHHSSTNQAPFPPQHQQTQQQQHQNQIQQLQQQQLHQQQQYHQASQADLNPRVDQQPLMQRPETSALSQYLCGQFGHAEFSDYIMQLSHTGYLFPPTMLPAHGVILARSPKLRSLITMQHSNAANSRNDLKQLGVPISDRFLNLEAALMKALMRLYGEVLPDRDMVARLASPLAYLEAGNIEAVQMRFALAYAAAGHFLQMDEIISHGLNLAASLMTWTTIAKALAFGLEGGLSSQFAQFETPTKDKGSASSVDGTLTKFDSPSSAPTYGFYSDRMISHAVNFLIYNCPLDFSLVTSAPQLSDPPRLPADAEPKHSRSTSRLSQIRFGEMTADDQTPRDPVHETMSSVLLSLPFPLLINVLESNILGERLGWTRVAEITREVVSEREQRRQRAAKNLGVNGPSSSVEDHLLRTLRCVEVVEPNDRNPSGLKLTRQMVGADTPPSTGSGNN